MLRRLVFIFSVLIFLTVGFSAGAYFNPGKPTGFVNDYTSTLKPEEISELETKLNQFSKDTSNEISVVIINSLEGDTIENFSVKLFEDWQIGQAKKDNGVLLLIAKNDRRMRIEPGYGLEGALPDITCSQIINKTLKPAFQKDDYFGGINQATEEIMMATRGEYQADPINANASALTNFFGRISFDSIIFIFIFIFYAISALRRHLAKSKAWWEGGIIGAAIGLFFALIFLRTLVYLLVIPLILALVGFLFDFLVSRVLPLPKPMGKGKGGGFWIFPGGSGGGSGGFGGGGFGGFGGGGSGGGGSSGSW